MEHGNGDTVRRVEDAAGLSTEDIAARAERVRDQLSVRVASMIASGRAAERDKLELELAEALGIPAEIAEQFGWSTLMGMVAGLRSIGDLVLGHAAVPNPEKRRELLVSFGVADYWARVEVVASAVGPTYRQALGLDDGPDAFRSPGPSPMEKPEEDR